MGITIQKAELVGAFLETLLYAPNPDNGHENNKLAVFLHPWSWLGGQMTDQCVPRCRVPFCPAQSSKRVADTRSGIH